MELPKFTPPHRNLQVPVCRLTALRRLPPLPTTPLCSLTQWWQPIPLLPAYPVNVFLVRQQEGEAAGSWVLIDAGVLGTKRQPLAAQLLTAVQATVPAEENLTAIARE
jgi:hypothetical protein